jgi:hypothetical protein
MAGLVVDRTVSPACSRLSAPATQLVALVAVAFGLLFGAMACAAGLAGGGHGAVERSALELDEMPMAHADHLTTMTESESQPMLPGDHGDHSGSTSTPGSHPGMACVVSVDLHFPEVSSVSISDSSEIPLMGLSTGRPADVDPPVPRFS